MKVILLIMLLIITLLYIPHGSDERYLSRYIVSTPEADFISHMVQMKVILLIMLLIITLLYIPHGSDESDLGCERV